MVEFAIILPVFLLILAGGFAVWEGLHGSVNLTSAARAGALKASSDLRLATTNNSNHLLTPADQVTALSDATQAVNEEEQTKNTFKSGACSTQCVTLTLTKGPITGTPEVVVSVQSRVTPSIPGLPTLNVFATATASYEQ